MKLISSSLMKLLNINMRFIQIVHNSIKVTMKKLYITRNTTIDNVDTSQWKINKWKYVTGSILRFYMAKPLKFDSNLNSQTELVGWDSESEGLGLLKMTGGTIAGSLFRVQIWNKKYHLQLKVTSTSIWKSNISKRFLD